VFQALTPAITTFLLLIQRTGPIARFVRNPSRETQRALQPYVVQVRDRDVARLQQMGALSPLDGFGYTLATPYRRLYEETFGLVLAEDSLADPSALLV